MTFFYNNLIEDATLTASSTASGLDVNNLKIPQLARVFSFVGNSGSVVIDLQSVQAIEYVLLDAGNMTEDVTAILQGNDTDVWTSPSYSENMIYTETTIYKELDEEYRYWRVVLSDINITELLFGYISIGANKLRMPTIDPKVTLYYNTTSKISYSIGGQAYADEGYEYLNTEFNFPQIGEERTLIGDTITASRKDILSMWSTTQNINPCFIFLWEESLDEHPPIFGVIATNKLKFKKVDWGKYYSVSIPIREVL